MEYAVFGLIGLFGYMYLQKGKVAKENGSQVKADLNSQLGRAVMGEGETDVTQYKDIGSRVVSKIHDLSEMGMVYNMEKANMIDVTNLNEAYKPWSAPDQNASNVPDLMAKQAETDAYLEATASPFYFNKNGEIFLGSATHDNLNVEIPSMSSIQHDHGATLATLPRVYIDSGTEQVAPTAEYSDGLLNAGQPTEMEMLRVQREKGSVYEASNPWGPGGAYPRIFNPRQEQVSRARGVDRSTRMANPYQ